MNHTRSSILEYGERTILLTDYYIWAHKKFDIGYNGKQIVDVNLTSDNRVKLQLGARISFSYEVNWKKSNIKFEDRFDKYLDPNFFQHRVSFTATLLLKITNKNINSDGAYMCILHKLNFFRYTGLAFLTAS